MEHTPGPWTATPCKGILKGQNLYDVRGPDGLRVNHSCEANARLIAAAPALLSALARALTITEEIERVSGQRHYNPGTLQVMANAIKLAKGD